MARHPTPPEPGMAEPVPIMKRGPAPGVIREPVPTAIRVNPTPAVKVRLPPRIRHNDRGLPATAVASYVHPIAVRGQRILKHFVGITNCTVGRRQRGLYRIGGAAV